LVNIADRRDIFCLRITDYIDDRLVNNSLSVGISLVLVVFLVDFLVASEFGAFFLVNFEAEDLRLKDCSFFFSKNEIRIRLKMNNSAYHEQYLRKTSAKIGSVYIGALFFWNIHILTVRAVNLRN
jgi:hypothetical protein